MPHCRGPSSYTRNILINGVTNSILLYVVPVWGGTLQRPKNSTILERVQKEPLDRLISEYRTVPTAALQVLAAEPSITLLMGDNRNLYDRAKIE
mgnify:FL=1